MNPHFKLKKYFVEWNSNRIGYTNFERADPPMGVIYGVLHLAEGIANSSHDPIRKWTIDECKP